MSLNGRADSRSATIVVGRSEGGSRAGNDRHHCAQRPECAGAGGATFFFFSGGPSLSNDGSMAFLGKLTGGSVSEGIFKGAEGSLIDIALGGRAPVAGGGTLFGFSPPPAVDATGTVAFNAGIGGRHRHERHFQGFGRKPDQCGLPGPERRAPAEVPFPVSHSPR